MTPEEISSLTHGLLIAGAALAFFLYIKLGTKKPELKYHDVFRQIAELDVAAISEKIAAAENIDDIIKCQDLIKNFEAHFIGRIERRILQRMIVDMYEDILKKVEAQVNSLGA